MHKKLAADLTSLAHSIFTNEEQRCLRLERESIRSL